MCVACGANITTFEFNKAAGKKIITIEDIYRNNNLATTKNLITIIELDRSQNHPMYWKGIDFFEILFFDF